MADASVTVPSISAAPVTSRRPLASRRFALELRQQMAWHRQALILGVSLIIGRSVSAAILVAAGVPANELLNEFVLQTLFDKQSLQAVLFQAAPMILVGIAASMAFRARFWNLGLEGQMIWGAIGATARNFEPEHPTADLQRAVCCLMCAANLDAPQNRQQLRRRDCLDGSGANPGEDIELETTDDLVGVAMDPLLREQAEPLACDRLECVLGAFDQRDLGAQPRIFGKR